MKLFNVGGIPIIWYNTNRITTDKEYDTIVMQDWGAHMYMNTETPGLVSKAYYVLEQPELVDLKTHCQSYLDRYINEVLSITNDFMITHSWLTKNPNGATHHSHNHPNSIFSGVYYLDAESSEVTFQFDTVFSKDFKFLYNYKESNEFNCKELTVSPRTGDMLIFPSWINHKVSKNIGSNDRIVIGFNSFVTGVLGTTDIHQYLNLDIKNAEH
jgi:uncharacterized protein (TIGR02466 family)